MREAVYRNYLLGVLLIIQASNGVDRLALGLLLQDIKIDFSLSDTQLGFLTGIAFALFYAVMGIPIARWADRGNRVTIIAITTALWSAAVALCGIAATFLQLLLIRIGVAVGEAGGVTPAYSLIADYFTRAERPRAVARYLQGGSLGLVLGYFVSGWLNEFYGWRVTFIVLGLPGIALAALAWLTLKEPRRRDPTKTDVGAVNSLLRPEIEASASAQASLKEVCMVLWANVTFRHLLFCWSVAGFFTYGIGQWQPAFFVRSYGFQTGELGTWFTVIYGLGCFLGFYCGGELASRHAAHNERLQLKAMAIAYCSSSLIFAFIFLSRNHYVAFGLLGLSAVVGTMTMVPLFATIQTLVPPRMRATAIAVLYLFCNLIGMGLGPLAAGALSDALRPLFGEDSLRYALLTLCPGYLWAAWYAWRGSHTVARDLQAVQAVCSAAPRAENVVEHRSNLTQAAN